MAVFASSSSLQTHLHSSLLAPSFEGAHGHNSWWVRVRSQNASGQRLHTHSKRGLKLKVKSAATKPAKSPAEEEWKIKREYLLQKRVRSVEVKEALRLQKENNFVLLDVRPEAQFKEAHPPGAINVQVYRLIKEWTAWDIARRAAFAFFGIFAGTEENPEFIKNVEAKLDKSAKIIVACSSGGTLRPSQNLPQGQQSRRAERELQVDSSEGRGTCKRHSDAQVRISTIL
ncbi:rhodanese-like domain-containing protein 14, chloroplastic isoform X2 [Cajanus cajan]|uniref:rhodanese-like domain-containing protein 14, chloroplastic isoform X2 n=1 Tax=Cajanus cajan TaxID=3821 RepID=UPI0010FB6AEE|nr:rhodanese-like domain-containing protein 14, chloroplastic isoform X2 [Cajanus cajan]